MGTLALADSHTHRPAVAVAVERLDVDAFGGANVTGSLDCGRPSLHFKFKLGVRTYMPVGN